MVVAEPHDLPRTRNLCCSETCWGGSESEETTCYVSVEYFRDHDPCADYVVHEAAHIFHNCKRATVGLPETRRRE